MKREKNVLFSHVTRTDSLTYIMLPTSDLSSLCQIIDQVTWYTDLGLHYLFLFVKSVNEFLILHTYSLKILWNFLKNIDRTFEYVLNQSNVFMFPRSQLMEMLLSNGLRIMSIHIQIHCICKSLIPMGYSCAVMCSKHCCLFPVR